MTERHEIDWWVAFADTGTWTWWDLVTRKGYRHCFAFRWDGFNWILVDPMSCWLEVQVMPYGPDEDVPKKMEELGHEVLYVRSSRENRFLWRGVLTCITVIKHLLGLRAWYVITPYQLKKYLCKEK